MKRLFSILVTLACAALHAQTQPSVFQQVLTNAVAPAVSAPVRNIGQQYSILAVVLSDATPGSCSATPETGTIQLEASYNNSNYFSIGTPLTTFTRGVFQTTSAPGSYSFIRVNAPLLDGNCLINAFYSGSISGTPIGSAPYSTFSEQFQVRGFSPISAAQSLVSCGPGRVVVYGLAVSNLTSTANSGSFTITNGATTTLNVGFAVPANGNYILPHGPRPYFRDDLNHPSSTNQDFEVFNLASLASASNISILVDFRCE